MKCSRRQSRIEIWRTDYINFPEKREPHDQDVIILQIEPAGKTDEFIVEIADPEEVPYL